MITYRSNKWRFIRITILWCLFFIAVYWYSASDRKREEARKFNRLDGNYLSRIEELSTPEGISNSDLTPATFDEDLDNENDNETNEYIAGQDFTNVNKFNDRNISTDDNDISNDLLYDDILPESMETTTVGEHRRNRKEDDDDLPETQMFIEDNTHQVHDGRTDVRNRQVKDANDENIETMSAQGSLIVSTLREHVNNVQILYPRRLHWTIAQAGTYSDKLYKPPPNEIPKQRLPQAIIIGFGKCGTRALINFLGMHPYIVTTGPEVHFFDLDENFQKGLEWYRQQMPVSYSNQITVEKTPSYITTERALNEIYKLNKRMKLIILLKDPVSRIVSQSIRSNPDITSTCLVERNGQLQVKNESRTVHWSIYVNFVRMWVEKFTREQIHVVETDEFVRNPAKEIQKLETFLGVMPMITEENFYFNKTKGFYCKRPLHNKRIVCLSEGKGMKHPALPRDVEKALYDFFRSHNEELFRLLGRRYNWEPTEIPYTSKGTK